MKKLAYLIIGLGLGFLICNLFFNNSTNMDNTEANPPKGIISPATAKQYDANYNARQKAASGVIGKEDNRSTWYSLEDIQNYINYAENQAGELGYTMDGIRIYLGAHSETDLTTMFLVPTGRNNTQKGSMLTTQIGSGDIGGSDPLNAGTSGVPPNHNYPQ